MEDKENLLKFYHQHFTKELERIQMSFDKVANKNSKSKYRFKFFCAFLSLTLAPFVVYYSGSFGIHLANNLHSLASTGETIPLVISLPQNVMWYYASAGFGVLVACTWMVDEMLGLVSGKKW